MVPKQEINGEWKEIKTAVVSAERNVMKTQGTPPGNERWDEECKKINQGKKRSKEKMVTTKDRNKLEH